MPFSFPSTLSRWSSVGVLAISLVTLASPADASVRHQGTWPEQEPAVSLKVEGAPRSAAIRQLAQAAGWSVVTRSLPETPVTLDVREQPPSHVLDQLLADGEFVADRDGSLISLGPAATVPAGLGAPASSAAPVGSEAAVAPPAAAPDAPIVPELPAAAADEPGEDRTVTGDNLRIGPDEVVGDVTVLGGNLELLGTANGDISVVGGSAHIYKGAHVTGDASAVGGSLVVDDGARVDGEVSVTGGSLGEEGGPRIKVSMTDSDDGDGHVALGVQRGSAMSTLSRLADDAGHAMERSLMLFVFGIILIALGGGRMETLQAEAAARPMRSLALGVVGFLASIVLFVALCVTVLGIPVAVAGVVAGLLLTGAGICAVLTTAGGALVGHRTKNPYLHLAVGSVLFLLVGSIPYLGGLVTAAVAFMGIGSLIATRVAGLVPPRRRNGVNQGPYRTAPSC